MQVHLIGVSLATAAALASSASGAINGAIWRSVTSQFGVPDPNGDPDYASLARYTFDLYLWGDAGAQIRGINMGNADDPSSSHLGLWTNGSVYNHMFGSDVRIPAFEGVFPGMAFDTFVALGRETPGPSISFASDPDLDADGVIDRVLRAQWYSDEGATLDGNGELRILRVTVGYPEGFDPYVWNAGGYLGTAPYGPPALEPQSRLQVLYLDGSTQEMIIGDGIQPLSPTPGATALFGIAGVAGMRRRRD